MSSQLQQDNAGGLDRNTRVALIIACLMGILAVSSTNMVIDLDLFHQMALFREMLAQGAMPLTDSFAYTPTRDIVVHHEWGMGAIQYAAMVGSGWGDAGLLVLKHVLTFAICFVCYMTARMNGASFATIIAFSPIALAVGGLIGFTNVRAQVMTLLFLAIQFQMFSFDDRGNRKWIFGWIPMMVAWTNVHGGVVAGAGIFLLWVGCRFLEAAVESNLVRATQLSAHRLSMAILLPALMCVNPYGFEYLPYLFRAVQMERPLIGEWQSMFSGADGMTLLMFSFSLFVAVVAVLLTLQKDRSKQALLNLVFPSCVIALTWVMAARHMRHVSIYGVAWICLVPAVMSRTELRGCIENSFANNRKLITKLCYAVAFIAFAASLNAPFWSVNTPAAADDGPPGAPIYPVRAIDFLEQKEIAGNMMVWFNDGAYVSWRMYPKIKVSLDSRYEVAYPAGAVEESIAFFAAEESWQEILQKYPTDLVLAPSQMPIKQAMQQSIDTGELPWNLIYSDESFTIFQKQNDRVTAN